MKTILLVQRELKDQALFDKIARKYARKDYVVSSSLARKNQLLVAVQPLLDKSSNLGTVVDVGCGVGASAKYLDGYYKHFLGIDHSKEMIKAAEVFNRDNPKAEFIAGNIKSKTLPENVADIILLIGVLHHTANLKAVMESLVRIAKPAAHLVAIEPQNRNLLIQTMRGIRKVTDASYSREQIAFSEKGLRALFTDYGISDLSIRFQGFLAPPFAQVVMHPQALVIPLSRLAVLIDGWFDHYLPELLKRLSFNIVVIGRFSK